MPSVKSAHNKTLSSRSLGILAASTTALIWGLQAIALKVSLNFASAQTVVFFRFTIATLLLILIMSLNKNWRPYLGVFKKPPLAFILAGIFLGLNYISFMKGLHFTGPNNAQVMIQLAPLGLALFGLVVFKEKLSGRQKLGFIVASIGFLIFFEDQLMASLQNKQKYLSGNLWLVFSAITWIAYALFQKQLSQRWPPNRILLIVFPAAALMYLPTASFEQIALWSPGVWLLMLSLGTTTLLAYGSLAFALNNIPASLTSIIITTNPILTFVAMEVLFRLQVSWIEQENIKAFGYAGALCVLAGVTLTVLKPRMKNY